MCCDHPKVRQVLKLDDFPAVIEAFGWRDSSAWRVTQRESAGSGFRISLPRQLDHASAIGRAIAIVRAREERLDAGGCVDSEGFLDPPGAAPFCMTDFERLRAQAAPALQNGKDTRIPAQRHHWESIADEFRLLAENAEALRPPTPGMLVGWGSDRAGLGAQRLRRP
jgi:hypothetical protein